MFQEELKAFKEELKATDKQLTFLEAQSQLDFKTTKLRAHLAALKAIRVGKLPKAHNKKPVTTNNKVPSRQSGQTRRTKTEMIVFRAQIKSACQLLGKRNESFTSSDVLNALIAQGFKGDQADRQIVRSTMLGFVKDGWLEKVGRGQWKMS